MQLGVGYFALLRWCIGDTGCQVLLPLARELRLQSEELYSLRARRGFWPPRLRAAAPSAACWLEDWGPGPAAPGTLGAATLGKSMASACLTPHELPYMSGGGKGSIWRCGSGAIRARLSSFV